ncbi:MAG: SIMPL domain-containing protein [Vulcanimicrobiota bacterium]
MQKIWIILTFILVGWGSLAAEPTGDHPPLISVIGKSEIWTAPDQIEFNLHLSCEESDPGQAMERNQKLVDGLRALLGKFRVEPGSFQVSEVSLERPYQNGVKKATFEASRECTFKLDDVKQKDQVLLTFARGELGEVRGARPTLKNPIPLREKARLEALKEARNKAQAMAASLQQSIGKAYWIEEVTPEFWNSPAANMVSRAPAEESPSGLGMIRVQSTVRASFLLQP